MYITNLDYFICVKINCLWDWYYNNVKLLQYWMNCSFQFIAMNIKLIAIVVNTLIILCYVYFNNNFLL